MSGWIKLEKDLREDPRFTRMVTALIEREAVPVTSVTQARYISNAAATRLLGGVAQLWMYADSHIREDDTLDIGADEVDQLVGLQGFSQLMPSDWLEVIDAKRVKLPGFQDHNGTSAKKKAVTQKRVARHRIRKAVTEVTPKKRSSVTAALPDQTRPDQTKEESATRVVGLDLESWNRWIEYRSASGKRLKPASMEEAAKKLASFGREQAAVVSHSIANGYQGLYAPKTGGQKPPPSDDLERESLRRRAEAIGFRAQQPNESWQVYQTLVTRAEDDHRRGKGPQRAVPQVLRQ